MVKSYYFRVSLLFLLLLFPFGLDLCFLSEDEMTI
uniref:Uncharacterized protein n=1 Tax=Tetranychus urticae TaxID=32264 RepID=T1JYI4_TETUR